MRTVAWLQKEIERKTKIRDEYWAEIQKHDSMSYSYPFHMSNEIDKLKLELQTKL